MKAESTQDAPDRAQEHREGFYCHGNAEKRLETLKPAQAGLRFLQQEVSPVGKRQMVQNPDSSSSAGSSPELWPGAQILRGAQSCLREAEQPGTSGDFKPGTGALPSSVTVRSRPGGCSLDPDMAGAQMCQRN